MRAKFHLRVLEVIEEMHRPPQISRLIRPYMRFPGFWSNSFQNRGNESFSISLAINAKKKLVNSWMHGQRIKVRRIKYASTKKINSSGWLKPRLSDTCKAHIYSCKNTEGAYTARVRSSDSKN